MLSNQFDNSPRHTLCRILNIHDQLAAIEKITEAVTIFVNDPDFIKQAFGKGHIMLNEITSPLRIDKVRDRTKAGVLYRFTKTVVRNIVNFVTVHRYGHRLTEFDVTENLTFFFVSGRYVDADNWR